MGPYRFAAGLLVLGSLPAVLPSVEPASVLAAGGVQRSITSITASPDGSEFVVVLNDDGADSQPNVFAIARNGSRVLWSRSDLPIAFGAAFSPSGKTVALAVSNLPQQKSVAQIVDAASGRTLQAIRQDDAPGYFPAETEHVAFSPDGTILYGLGESYLYAWDTRAGKLLWTSDVPGGKPTSKLDRATSFAVASSGTTLGLNRFGLSYLVQAGPTAPPGGKKLPGSVSNVGDQPAFSPDSRFFVTGYGYNSSFSSSPGHYSRGGMLWRLDGGKPVPVRNCGGYFAWTANPAVFACGNFSGTHLRNVSDPGKDVGAAGPVSDLPFVQVGNSVWAAAYKVDDWKDPGNPLSVTLVELGSGKQVVVNLPGRFAAASH